MSSADYPGATWYGAHPNNYTDANRPGSDPINKIVIHVVQGSFSSTINWFLDPNANVSAHYTVRSSDGFVGQSVHEEDIAYHAGWWDYNRASVGIEHEGYVGDPSWFTDAMYRSSAKLSAYLCKKYAIPIDRQHIIGHNEVPGCSGGSGGGVGCHTDPGPYWDWGRYTDLVKEYAGVSTTTYAQVVDNATAERFYAASNWGTSSWSTQKYAGDYRYAKPGTTTIEAKFKVKIPSRGKYAVYGWWPADPGYNDRARFRIYTSDGWKGKVVSQRTNGGKWVWLGTHAMDAGDGWYVRVSNRSTGEGYVIADAVRIVKK
ncbi:MAG: N-acetylmuramoyl-L-alanine amidase [Actinomycetota bacterium]|nr:N-acetylmuramoyl-L-alanine amidase [Actinomycetota bacterium]